MIHTGKTGTSQLQSSATMVSFALTCRLFKRYQRCRLQTIEHCCKISVESQQCRNPEDSIHTLLWLLCSCICCLSVIEECNLKSPTFNDSNAMLHWKCCHKTMMMSTSHSSMGEYNRTSGAVELTSNLHKKECHHNCKSCLFCRQVAKLWDPLQIAVCDLELESIFS